MAHRRAISERSNPRHRSRHAGILLGGVVCAGLLVAPITPAWAEAGAADESAGSVVGGFGVGDGIEALVDERDGALTFALPAGGLDLTWDSRAVSSDDRSGLGKGWGLGLGAVQTAGGVQFSPASGGRYELDSSHASGLHGYGARDIAFRMVDDGRVPARTDAAVADRAYRYRLHELGGTVTSFNELGDPITRASATGQRVDWVWSADVAHRLERIVDADGVVTELEWAPDAVVVRPAANLPLPDGADGAPEWRVELGDDGITAIEDPTGGRVEVAYESGLVRSIGGVAGVRTEVEWRSSDDGAARVARVVAVDGDGVEVSRREWSPIGADLPSGWPAQQVGAASRFLAAGGYSTELTDGSTAVRSTYSAAHLLSARSMLVTTAGGERVVQQQSFRYPADELPGGGPDPAALPGDWNRPTSVSVTRGAADGSERTTTSTSEFDDLGRPVRVAAPDGVTTQTVYDETVPAGAPVPIGLATSVTAVADDGQVTETTNTLNTERTAVVATETRAGRTDAPLTLTGATEYTVEPDGFVSERREYPAGDRAQRPLVTRWAAAIDLTAGTSTATEIAAAGTSVETSASVTSSLRHGGVLEATDATGARATTEYDELGRPVSTTDAAERTTTTTYETAQQDGRNAVTVTMPDGVARTEVRDGVGRVRVVADNLAHGVATPGHVRVAETREYLSAGTVVVTDAWGATTTSRQDAFGRPVATESPGGVTQLTRYDDVANTVTRAITATGRLADAELVSVDTLDSAGRTIATRASRDDALEVAPTATEFDGLGRPTASVDGTVRSETAYDAFGNAAKTTLTPQLTDGSGLEAGPGAAAPPAGGVVTERRFDANGTGLGKTVTDATGTATGGSRAFDELGRVTSMTDQAGRVTTTEYTADGLVARVVDGNGQISGYTYDDRTRQLVQTTTEAPGRATVATVAEYDDRTGRLTRIAETSDPAGTEVRYSYDDFGNVRSITYPGGREISHRYDEHGRRVATTDATGATTTFEYRADGLMTSAVQTATVDPSSPVVARVGYCYDALGRTAAVDRGNGVTTAYTFTSASEIASELTTRDGVELSARTYEYAPSGLLVARVDRERDEQTGETDIATTAYRYDALDRLVESTVHEGASVDAPVALRTAYTATVSGDLATEVVTSEPGTADEHRTTREFAYSALGELTAITTDGARVDQTYDAAGNLVRGADGTTYAYDAANRPISRTRDGQTVQTSYWGDGARRSLTRVDEPGADPVQTTYYWDGATLVNEVHTEAGAAGYAVGSAGGEAASYLLGATRHARTIVDGDGRRTAYLGVDRHGNVTDLTDDGGAVQTRYAYSDYGVQTTVSSDVGAVTGLARNPFGYAGEQTDDDGSLYLRARVYEPVTARFTSEDQAERLDRYNYADLNPIMKVDPSGRTAEWDEIVDLVTGGLALASLAGSAVMAAFTGGLSLTGLGIMGIASDVVTVLAVTARAVDRELPDLGILDEDGEDVLLGVEIAFGALGAAGVAADLFQLDVAQALYAVERDADRILNASHDISAAVMGPQSRIMSEHFGAPTRRRKFNIDAELKRGDRMLAMIDARMRTRQAIVDEIRKFGDAYAVELDQTPFLLRGYGSERVLTKIETIRGAGGDAGPLADEILSAKVGWAETKYEVDLVRARLQAPQVAPAELPWPTSSSSALPPAHSDPSPSLDLSSSDDDGLGFSFIADAFR